MRRKGRQRDSGLADVLDEEIVRRAHDRTLAREDRKRYQREEKARGLRNKQRRSAEGSRKLLQNPTF